MKRAIVLMLVVVCLVLVVSVVSAGGKGSDPLEECKWFEANYPEYFYVYYRNLGQCLAEWSALLSIEGCKDMQESDPDFFYSYFDSVGDCVSADRGGIAQFCIEWWDDPVYQYNFGWENAGDCVSELIEYKR